MRIPHRQATMGAGFIDKRRAMASVAPSNDFPGIRCLQPRMGSSTTPHGAVRRL